MADKCRNEGCGCFSESYKENCVQVDETEGRGEHEFHVTDCALFTTTPTESITTERLKELEKVEREYSNALDVKENILLQSENKRLAGEVERGDKLMMKVQEVLKRISENHRGLLETYSSTSITRAEYYVEKITSEITAHLTDKV